MYAPLELEEAQENFHMGLICAQQLFAHFAERLGLPEETALRIASPFGAGMGQAEVCGCVTGSLMVLGMREQLPYSRVISAGFVELGPSGFVCTGGNPELQLTARPKEDAAIIAEALRQR